MFSVSRGCGARVQDSPRVYDEQLVNSFIPLFSLRQNVRLLDSDKLPGGLRDVRLQRDIVQPRVSPERRELRDEEDHPGSG